jgi:hypothetical protein
MIYARSLSRPAISALLVICSTAAQATPCTLGPYSDEARFHDLARVACHNCFEPQHAEKRGAKTFKEVLDRVSVVELDFHDTTSGAGIAGAWYVRHTSWGFGSGNDNVCTGHGSGTNDLRACVRDIAEWSAAHPRHANLVVYLDKKQGWSGSRSPAHLDFLLAQTIPPQSLFKPNTMRGSHPSARAAAAAGDWPTLGELRGKIMFVLTGGNDDLNEYVEVRGASAVAFVAARASKPSHVSSTPHDMSSSTAPWVVFYNLERPDHTLGPLVHDRGGIARLWGGYGLSFLGLVEAVHEVSGETPVLGAVQQCVNAVALFDYTRNPYALQGQRRGVLQTSAMPLHHHHKLGRNCTHGKWATDEAQGHHHHERGSNCEHYQWATNDVQGHHHHLRDEDCSERDEWATDEGR